MKLNRTQQRERRDGCPFVSVVSFSGTVLLALGVWLPLDGTVFAAGAADPATPKRGGTLRVAWRSDPQYLDPALVGDYFNVTLARLCYHGLLDYDDGDNLVPWLAEAMPALSSDQRTYTFHLRRGVHFSNGRELEAADFVYSLERSLDPKTGSPYQRFALNIAGAAAFSDARSNELASAAAKPRSAIGRWLEPTNVAGLKALDRYTLRIQLEQPEPPFLFYLTMPFCFAVPREEVEKSGTAFSSHPVGVGPFLLKEWRRGARLRFERNPRYYLAEQPWFDALDAMIGVDEATAEMMFERGELDLVLSICPGDFVRLSKNTRWKGRMRSLLMNATAFVALNCKMPPFTDVRVRQAMNYAVDKDRIRTLVHRRGQAAQGVLPPLMPGHNPGLKGYPFDAAKARQLLREAGYTNGLDVHLWLGMDPDLGKVAYALKQYLGNVGVRVEVNRIMDPALMAKAVRTNELQSALTYLIQDYPDPSEFLEKFLGGQSLNGNSGWNWAFYGNSEYDAAVSRAAQETDPIRRLGLYSQAEAIAVRDAPWLFLFHPMDYRMVQPWVKGFRMHSVWQVRYDKLWIDN